MNVRKIALIAFVATSLSVLIPTWSATQAILVTAADHPGPGTQFWSIATIVFGGLFSAIIPVFYFAVYRNHGILSFSKPLRAFSLAAAIAFGIVVVADAPRLIGSLGFYWSTLKTVNWRGGATSVLAAARNPGTIIFLSNILAELANLGSILLLIAVFRSASTELDEDVPLSRLLYLVSKVAIIARGLWLTFTIARMIYIPYLHAQLRHLALQLGRTPPSLGSMMEEPIRSLLFSACLFAAPFVVYKSRPKAV